MLWSLVKCGLGEPCDGGTWRQVMFGSKKTVCLIPCRRFSALRIAEIVAASNLSIIGIWRSGLRPAGSGALRMS